MVFDQFAWRSTVSGSDKSARVGAGYWSFCPVIGRLFLSHADSLIVKAKREQQEAPNRNTKPEPFRFDLLET